MEKKSKSRFGAAASIGATGLNAAAIVFLFTYFVPRQEFTDAKTKVEKLDEKIYLQQQQISVLQGLVGKSFKFE